MGSEPAQPPDALRAGWDALAVGAWDVAHAAFARASADAAAPEAFEGLGFAAWWLDDGDGAFRARETAYRLYLGRGDPRGAARVAVWLSMDHFTRRGERAVANGLVRRAERLLDGLAHGPEHALVRAWDAHMAILADHDADAARRLGAEAASIARDVGASDLALMAQACEGFARVCAGEVAGGMRLLDEAGAAVLAGEMTDPDAMTLSCCYLIYACERVRDVERAAQWCDRLFDLARRWNYGAMFAFCRTHFAGMLIWRGAWAEAEAELAAATDGLTATGHPALAVESVARLADLRRRQGRFAEAAALLARLDDPPLRMLGRIPALLGGAQLALAGGEWAEAADLAGRFLRAVPPGDRLARVAGLELLVRAGTALGDGRLADGPLRELRDIAASVGTAPLRAAAIHAEAVVAVAAGDYETARQGFAEALDLFDRGGAPYEAAHARLDLAGALAGLLRDHEAAREAEAAEAELRRLGAERDAERASSLARLFSRAAPEPSATSLVHLSARELEVLRLVAQGLGDKEVAAALGLSEHTVHRHVSNVLAKLDVPSRAAAVALAARRDIL